MAQTYINTINIEGEDKISYGIEGQMCYNELELDIDQQDILLADTHEYLVYHLGEKRAKATMQRILADSGANNSFYNDLSKIHNMQWYRTPTRAYVADKRAVKVLGYGELHLEADDGRIVKIPVKYSPQLPKILSTRHLKKCYPKKWHKARIDDNGDEGSVILQGTMEQGDNIGSTVKFSTTYIGDLPYINAEPISVPQDQAHFLKSNPEVVCSIDMRDEDNEQYDISTINNISTHMNDTDEFIAYIEQLQGINQEIEKTPMIQVNTMTIKATNTLWHNRLVHHNYQDLANLHKTVDGVPKITVPPDNGVCPCSACITGKITDANMGKEDKHCIPTEAMQGLHMDFGFVQNILKK